MDFLSKCIRLNKSAFIEIAHPNPIPHGMFKITNLFKLPLHMHTNKPSAISRKLPRIGYDLLREFT